MRGLLLSLRPAHQVSDNAGSGKQAGDTRAECGAKTRLTLAERAAEQTFFGRILQDVFVEAQLGGELLELAILLREPIGLPPLADAC